MTKDEALKLALEALEDLRDQTETPPDGNCSCHIAPPCADCVDYSGIRYAIKQATKAITAIKEALAQPEQEPVRLQCVKCGTVYADGVPPQVAQPEERYFCQRCGKRVNLTMIHTCTPPQIDPNQWAFDNGLEST
jgi:Zn finger protein HypA/HybF involved in hydrogenase expression